MLSSGTHAGDGVLTAVLARSGGGGPSAECRVCGKHGLGPTKAFAGRRSRNRTCGRGVGLHRHPALRATFRQASWGRRLLACDPEMYEHCRSSAGAATKHPAGRRASYAASGLLPPALRLGVAMTGSARRMSLHKEISFEDEICDHLAAHGWLYEAGSASAL